MMEILKFTHQFLQKFCAGNQENQALLHKHLNLFLTPGVRIEDGRAVAGSSTGRDLSNTPGAESQEIEKPGGDPRRGRVRAGGEAVPCSPPASLCSPGPAALGG